jgi:hypothetical protein
MDRTKTICLPTKVGGDIMLHIQRKTIFWVKTSGKPCGDRKSIIALTYMLSIYIVHSRRHTFHKMTENQ